MTASHIMPPVRAPDELGGFLLNVPEIKRIVHGLTHAGALPSERSPKSEELFTAAPEQGASGTPADLHAARAGLRSVSA